MLQKMGARRSGHALVVWIVDVRWSEYVSHSGGDQMVIWTSGVCPDVYLGIDTRLESSENLSSQSS